MKSVSSIQLCRTMLCRMETEVVKEIVNRLWTKGCVETDKRRHAHERSCPSSGQRRSFPSSSVLGQMSHYSWLTRWMCARCSNEENLLVDAWLKTDFIKLSWGYSRQNITGLGSCWEGVSCIILQHTTTHCNTLQLTASHCNTLQLTATHCNTLQHTATHCNTLQHTATHYHGSPRGVGWPNHIQNPDSLLKLCQSRASAKKGQGACKWMNPEWVMSPVYDSYLQTVHSSIEFMARSISFVHKERMSFFLLFPFLERWAWILTFQESAPGWWSIMNLQVLLKYSLP